MEVATNDHLVRAGDQNGYLALLVAVAKATAVAVLSLEMHSVGPV